MKTMYFSIVAKRVLNSLIKKATQSQLGMRGNNTTKNTFLAKKLNISLGRMVTLMPSTYSNRRFRSFGEQRRRKSKHRSSRMSMARL